MSHAARGMIHVRFVTKHLARLPSFSFGAHVKWESDDEETNLVFVAVGLLAAGISAASATGMQSSNAKMSQHHALNKMSMHKNNSTQLGRHFADQKPPSGVTEPWNSADLGG